MIFGIITNDGNWSPPLEGDDLKQTGFPREPLNFSHLQGYRGRPELEEPTPKATPPPSPEGNLTGGSHD
jgi:hypothetical protein